MKSVARVSVVIVSRDRKKDLTECLESYSKSIYKNLEIIVVDNASNPPLAGWVKKKYPKVKLIRSGENTGAAQGRNIGLRASSGEYVLFTDDDAYADKDMISHLVEAFEKEPQAGIIQPLVYDKEKKNYLQGAGHDIDLATGRIKAWGVREEDIGQYEGLREVPLCGCVWMAKRELLNKIGGYDEEYFIPYEDSDFSLRAKRAGFRLFCYSSAKTYHQGHKSTYVHPLVEWLGITTKERAFRVARNKIIYISKNANLRDFLVFLFIMLPFYIFMHSFIILLSGRWDILRSYWGGAASGLNYIFSSKINIMLLSWSEPIGWMIMRNPKSLLDLGCGPGKVMNMIKHRTKVGNAVGIDIYMPFIEQCKIEGKFDELILSDINKINYPSKSFDVVLANQVIEHLTKKDAMNLISKMEKIAKKQVIISTPIGEIEDPEHHGNKYQKHRSAFMPADFEQRGYKTIKYGYRWLLGPEGLAMNASSSLARKLYFLLNFLLTPVYYIWQGSCDYYFVATKNIGD